MPLTSPSSAVSNVHSTSSAAPRIAGSGHRRVGHPQRGRCEPHGQGHGADQGDGSRGEQDAPEHSTHAQPVAPAPSGPAPPDAGSRAGRRARALRASDPAPGEDGQLHDADQEPRPTDGQPPLRAPIRELVALHEEDQRRRPPTARARPGSPGSRHRAQAPTAARSGVDMATTLTRRRKGPGSAKGRHGGQRDQPQEHGQGEEPTGPRVHGSGPGLFRDGLRMGAAPEGQGDDATIGGGHPVGAHPERGPGGATDRHEEPTRAARPGRRPRHRGAGTGVALEPAARGVVTTLG